MTHSIRRGISLAAVIGLVAAVTACTSGNSTKPSGNGSQAANVPGVTATTITIGTHQPLTGPAAPGYSKISAATNAYFQYVNAHGGVNGRTIKYLVKDDGYNPTNTASVIHELIQQDNVFAILNGLGTPTHTNVLDFINQSKVPDLFVASGSVNWNQPDKYPYTFGYQTDYTVEGKILGSYIKANFAGKKVCFLGQNDDFGQNELAGLLKELGPNAISGPANQNYTVTNPDVKPQIGALAGAKCEVVVAATIPGFTALSLGTAAAFKYHPQWIVSNVGADYATVEGLLKGAPLMEGVITDGYLPAASNDADPWITLFKQINTQYNGNAPWDGNVEYGMAVGYQFVQALVKAGKNLTRDGLVAAVEGGGFSGPAVVPAAYSKTNHSGYTGAQLAKITGGVTTSFGDVYVTDDGDGAVSTIASAEQTQVPSNGVPTS